ncbi:hypothetical protein [Acidovorax sp. Root275]|uniref:hypothetical protein n=1 Tax=Acidovorax sp. Root275 TaxID=1736508 RepID=UPI00112505D9|nr:hypothetical protein [Acidovorax sp. Root275]
MWSAARKAAISEVVLLVVFVLTLMGKAGTGSGLPFLFLVPVAYVFSLVRIYIVLTVATQLSASRNVFWFFAMALGFFSGLAIATGLRESGLNLVLLTTLLGLSTAAGCYFAPDET